MRTLLKSTVHINEQLFVDFDKPTPLSEFVNEGALPKRRILCSGEYWYVKGSSRWSFMDDIPQIGYQSFCEIAASWIGRQLFQERMLEYVACWININGGQQFACASKSFKHEGIERYLTLYDILSTDTIYANLLDMKELTLLGGQAFEPLCERLYKITELDWTDYLKEHILLDYIIGNDDRHLRNIGVIQRRSGIYRFPQISDNGAGLFGGVADDLMTWDSYEVLCEVLASAPFEGEPAKQIGIVGKKWLIPYLPIIQQIRDDIENFLIGEFCERFEISETRLMLMAAFVEDRCNDILEVF